MKMGEFKVFACWGMTFELLKIIAHITPNWVKIGE